MIVLTRGLMEDMIAYSLGELPHEACGLVAGAEKEGRRIVERLYLIANVERSPVHYTMDPREQVVAMMDIQATGRELLGYFHSHPATAACPSDEDIRLAYDPSASYLILSLADPERPVVKSFRIRDGLVREEEVQVAH